MGLSRMMGSPARMPSFSIFSLHFSPCIWSSRYSCVGLMPLSPVRCPGSEKWMAPRASMVPPWMSLYLPGFLGS